MTAFFDLGRSEWTGFERDVNYYLERAKRICTLEDKMVFFVQPEFVNFIKEQRIHQAHQTKIIPMQIEELPCYHYMNTIEKIMHDPEFRDGLAEPSCPEVTEPLYNVVMWSKIPLVRRVVEENPFDSSHFVWLDFGMKPEILKDHRLYKPLLKNIPDKIKIMCMHYPGVEDLTIKKFLKSHSNRLAGTMLTGGGKHFKLLDAYFEEEVKNCLNQNLVDNDQSLLALVFLKHPEIFELYYGYWGELIENYDEVTRNLSAVMDIALTCKMKGHLIAYHEILSHIKNYDPQLWRL